MPASISAQFSRARFRAQRISLQFFLTKSSDAMAFQWPGGVYVPTPSAQNCTIFIWSRLGLFTFPATSVTSDFISSLLVEGGGPGRNATMVAESKRKHFTLPNRGSMGGRA